MADRSAGEVLPIVSQEYEVVENRDAFRFPDALIGSELHLETAGSTCGAVTAAVTPIRIVCANTLRAALRQAERGASARRTFRFRHTGNLQTKFAEARQVLGMTINYQKQFKALADQLALEAISPRALEHRVLRHLCTIDDDTGPRARANRERAIEHVLAIFRGHGPAGDTTGNSPGSKWVAFNAIAEHLDYGPRYTTRSSQVQRSFEDTSLKQRALELVSAA